MKNHKKHRRETAALRCSCQVPFMQQSILLSVCVAMRCRDEGRLRTRLAERWHSKSNEKKLAKHVFSKHFRHGCLGILVQERCQTCLSIFRPGLCHHGGDIANEGHVLPQLGVQLLHRRQRPMWPVVQRQMVTTSVTLEFKQLLIPSSHRAHTQEWGDFLCAFTAAHMCRQRNPDFVSQFPTAAAQYLPLLHSSDLQPQLSLCVRHKFAISRPPSCVGLAKTSRFSKNKKKSN